MKNKKFRRNLAFTLIVSFVLATLSAFANPQVAQAAMRPDITNLTITGNGVRQEIVIPIEDLLAMPRTTQYFSASNTWPSPRHVIAEGLWLEDLLNMAGLEDDARHVIFHAADGVTFDLNLNYLLNESAYYFPNILVGSDEGRVPVGPMLALRYAESHSSPLSYRDAPRLSFGQRHVTDQTYNNFAKFVFRIEVTTEDKGQFDLPTASHPSGVVEQGTEIMLATSGGRGAKIYYTIDGGDPTWSSIIFNRSDFVQNPPIVLHGDPGQTITIRARVLGSMRAASDIATFTYTLSGDPQPAILLTEPGPTQIFRPGETVTIGGRALNIDSIDTIRVLDPRAVTVASFSASEILIDSNGNFSVSFTLSSNPEIGFYNVEAIYSAANVVAETRFQVREDSVFDPILNDGSRPDLIFTSFNTNPSTERTIQARIRKDSNEQTNMIVMPEQDWNGVLNANGRLENWNDIMYSSPVREEVDEWHYIVRWNPNNLTPNTRYVAQVGGDDHWSEPFFFTTSNDDANSPFSFMYLGDVQEGYSQWGNMILGAHSNFPNIRFGLIGGDLVDGGGNNYEWQTFMTEAAPVFSEVAMAAVPGNHCDGVFFYRYLQNLFPGDVNSTFRDIGIYSFTYGNAHFTMLNTNFMGNPGLPMHDALRTWLENDLRNAADKQWRFVVMHYPPFPVRIANNFDPQALQTHWAPIFEEYDVDIVFVGHQHSYARTYPIRDGIVQDCPSEGIVYIMGNSGIKFYEAASYDYVAVSADFVSNYQIIDIDGTTLILRSYDQLHNLIDEFTIEKADSLDPTRVLFEIEDLRNGANRTYFVTEAVAATATEDVAYNFTSINTFGSPRRYENARGPILTNLFDELAIDMNGNDSIQFVARDGFNATMRWDFLTAERYFFPNQPSFLIQGQASAEAFNARVRVDAIIDMNPTDPNTIGRLMLGQIAPHEQTNNLFVHSIAEFNGSYGRIILRDGNDDSFPVITGVDPASGSIVDDGVQITFTEPLLISPTDGFIYFTTDGRDPTPNSFLYNFNTFLGASGQVFRPVIRAEDADSNGIVTLKARVFGANRRPSEIATFQYHINDFVTTTETDSTTEADTTTTTTTEADTTTTTEVDTTTTTTTTAPQQPTWGRTRRAVPPAAAPSERAAPSNQEPTAARNNIVIQSQINAGAGIAELALAEGTNNVTLNNATLNALKSAGIPLVLSRGIVSVTLPVNFSNNLTGRAETINISFTEIIGSGNVLASGSISITDGNTPLTNLTVPYILTADLSEFNLSDMNPNRIVASINGRHVGGMVRNGIFELDGILGTGTYQISYVPTLIRATVQLESTTITDLAGNSRAGEMDVVPVIVNDRALVPVRFIAENILNLPNVGWDHGTRTVTLYDNGRNLSFAIGEMAPGMDVPAQIIGDRTMVPIRFVSEFFGATVNFDHSTRVIEITR